MSGVGRQEGAGKPPSTRASQVGEVLEESEQVTIYRLAQGPGRDSAHGMGGSVKVFLRQGI